MKTNNSIGFISIFAFALMTITLFNCQPSAPKDQMVQLTKGGYNHDLDNNDNFSPDGKWLAYDIRSGNNGIGGSPSVERVNIETGKVEVLFSISDGLTNGLGAGAVSYHPFENKVIFIHGIEHDKSLNPYQQWKRTGVIVEDNHPNIPIYMDARDITFPFTPGALRGGTHRHEWSKDGKWIGFTYNDAIMKAIEDSTGEKVNLRTVGVSTKINPVYVDHSGEGENINGEYYSVLVVRVVPNPTPGSDEISNAASDSWVGSGSYVNKKGNRQVARAFLGKVRNKANQPVDELFVVDIPDSINHPGEFGPLQGTRTTFPMPPKGTVTRRLTHTAETTHPGCGGVVRSSSDGKWISYQAADSLGIQQLFLISPDGGIPRQLTFHPGGVQSGARWSPYNQSVIYVSENSILVCKISRKPFEQRFRRLTPVSKDEVSNIVLSPDGKTIAFNRLVKDGSSDKSWKQIFLVKVSPEVH